MIMIRPKKKIAVFGLKYFPSKGGTSRVIENLVKQLKNKYDFTLFCYKNKQASRDMEEINVIAIPKISLGSFAVFVYYFLCCVYIIFKGEYDLIHVHKIDAAFFIPILSLKTKVIATSHESPYRRDKWSLIAKLYFHINEIIFIKSRSTLTSISRPLSEYYKNKFNRKVIYIPNGVDTVTDYNDKEANNIQKKYSTHNDYIMFAARRIIPTKGCHTFLEALKKINFKGTVLIAGDTNQVPKYTIKLKKISQDLDLKFIGFISSLKTLLALIHKSELFVFPSESEGMSIMLLEVASAGTPIICSDIPENIEVFNNKEVLFFQNKNSIDLANKIEYAKKNRMQMEKRANLARKKVLKYHSWKNISEKYYKLYKKLIY